MNKKPKKSKVRESKDQEKPLTKEGFFKVLNKVIGTKKPDEKRSGAGKTKTSE